MGLFPEEASLSQLLLVLYSCIFLPKQIRKHFWFRFVSVTFRKQKKSKASAYLYLSQSWMASFEIDVQSTTLPVIKDKNRFRGRACGQSSVSLDTLPFSISVLIKAVYIYILNTCDFLSSLKKLTRQSKLCL